jgi:hypothetical protein
MKAMNHLKLCLVGPMQPSSVGRLAGISAATIYRGDNRLIKHENTTVERREVFRARATGVYPRLRDPTSSD